MPIDPKNLAAGVKELRATANLLLAWADDLAKGAPAPKPAPTAKNPFPPVPTAPFEAQAGAHRVLRREDPLRSAGGSLRRHRGNALADVRSCRGGAEGGSR